MNFDDYLKFELGTSLNRSLDWKIGNHVMQMTPFASAGYFLDDLEIGESKELFTAIESDFEIGVTFSSEPRMYLKMIRVPNMKVSFNFGDEVKGFKIRF